MVQQHRRLRRSVQPARKPVPAARPMLPADRRGKKLPGWVIALAALACAGVVFLVLTSEGSPSTDRTPSDALAPADGAAGDEPSEAGQAPAATVAARFAQPALADDVELRVLSLGTDPSRCHAVSLRIDGEVKTPYHHRCEDRNADLAFFLVRMTGSAKDPVTIDLDGFALVTDDGRTLTPVLIPDVSKAFPEEIALGSGGSRKGWVLFELDAVPTSLRYVAGDQELVVRFPDTWL